MFLLDQFGIHREILTCKATDASTNLKKQEIWRLICQNLNTHNTLVRRTPAEVRRKWKNLVTAAKKEVWEMRHQIHLSGGAGTNGRKISELSQRVLQLHSSGGFSSANPNGLYGTLLSAGLIGPPPVSGMGGVDKYGGNKYEDDKSYIPAHFTPIITLSESNNNHILMGSGHSGDGPPSPLSEEDDDESSDSRNATEFMSDSGIYEQEGIDLRVNVSSRSASVGGGGGMMANGGSHHGANGGFRGIGLENGRSHQLKNSDPGDDEDDDVEDCDEDVEVEDMSLVRFASHLGLREKFRKGSPAPVNPFITSALLNVNVNNNNRSVNNNVNNNVRDFERERRMTGEVALYNNNAPRQPISPRTVEEVRLVNGPSGGRKSSETTEEISSRPSISALNGELLDATLRLRNHFLDTLKESDLLSSLYKERLELQIEVLKLRKQKLSQELEGRRLRSNKGHLNGLLTTANARSGRLRAAKERRSRIRSHCFGSFFRLKPKNTWINFAAKEKLLQEGGDGKKSEMVNGVNGRDDSDPEDKR